MRKGLLLLLDTQCNELDVIDINKTAKFYIRLGKFKICNNNKIKLTGNYTLSVLVFGNLIGLLSRNTEKYYSLSRGIVALRS